MLDTNVSKTQLTDHFKTAVTKTSTVIICSTQKKALCKVRTKNKACNPICKLLNTIYKHPINAQKWKGILNIASGVVYFFVLFGNM